MEYMFALPALLFIGVMVFEAGRNLTKYPSEEEMMGRLIRMRTERKMAAITKADLEKEVEEASERLVRG